jgi:predicted nuclease of predicted toxin-antitoxin system
VNASDTEIMGYASTHGYVVLTHDLDFSAILAATDGGRPSVVEIRAEDVGIAAIGTQVVAALRQMESDLEAGVLLTIEPSRMRIRFLPLQRQ